VFDRDGNAELGFPEYNEAWRFLSQPGNDSDIKKAFDSVDVDGTGLVDWDEFVFSIMGEAALKYGTLADMEKLTTLLDSTLKDYNMIRDTLGEVRADNDARAVRNKELRNRLDNMKDDVQSTINGLIADMMNIDPRDVMSEAEIDHHLEQAFAKFDADNSGELGEWEFKQAWVFLGLKGPEREIGNTFKGVDTNNSGLIDLGEFKPELFVSTPLNVFPISRSGPFNPKKTQACLNSHSPNSPLLSASNLANACSRWWSISASLMTSRGSIFIISAINPLIVLWTSSFMLSNRLRNSLFLTARASLSARTSPRVSRIML
jgi:Ca2+-binding EF-hand superfamily protein